MAEESQDKSQKTEDPTQKRLEDSRKKGQIPSSREVNNRIMILAGTLVVMIFRQRLRETRAMRWSSPSNSRTPFC
jgi:flagellar biosynthetic protein FlhB